MGCVFWLKYEPFFGKIPPPTFEKLRSGGAGIPFPQTPFPSRPALAFAAAEFRFSLREKRR